MSKLDFPVPYPDQLPGDELGIARMLLNAVTLRMEDGIRLAPKDVQSLFVVLCAAAEKLEMIQLFLDDLEFTDLGKQYLAARRLWVMQKGGAK